MNGAPREAPGGAQRVVRPARPRPILLYLLNDGPFFVSHRLPIAIAAQREGYEVHLAAPDPCPPEVAAAGIAFHPIPLSRSGANPIAELASLIAIFRLFRRLRPDLVHAVTIKPVLYGGLAARAARVPAFVAAVSGLGPAFRGSAWRSSRGRTAVRLLYRSALRHPNSRVIFQNDEDRLTLGALARLPETHSVMIMGSGVDLAEYRASAEPAGYPVVLMASRLVKDKGPALFVKAAQLVRQQRPDVTFRLAGAPDPGSPGAIEAAEIDAWKEEGVVELLGHRQDVQELLAASHIVVHPSAYGEGLPRVLIEAAASARAVVTTDHPGCRDAILPDVTGILVPPGDAVGLAEAIVALVDDADLRRQMGEAGRALAESRYSIESVVEAHLLVYSDLRRAADGSRRGTV